MKKPLDYLAAAAILAVRGSSSKSITSMKGLIDEFQANFSEGLNQSRAGALVRKLADEGLVSVVEDPYAGTYFKPISPVVFAIRLQSSQTSSVSEDVRFLVDEGPMLLRRALKNPKFWIDLDNQISQENNGDIASLSDEDDGIPASDRIVSLSHNQFKEIEEPTLELIDLLEADNGIPDEPGVKERLLGQIKAGRELLQAGEFAVWSFQSTMLDGLNTAIQKYGDHAIGAAASALMTLILHILEIPGF